MKDMIKRICVLLIFSSTCSAVTCNQFIYKEKVLSCGFDRNFTLNNGSTIEVLVCNDWMKTEVCTDIPGGRCGFSWEYDRRYETLGILNCSVIHNDKLLDCDLSKIKTHPSTTKRNADVLELEMPSCSKGDIYNILRRRYDVNPAGEGFEKSFIFGGKDMEEVSIFQMVIPSDVHLSYYSSLNTDPYVFTQDGLTHVIWEKRNVSPGVKEDFMPENYEIFDTIHVSSDLNYSNIHDWIAKSYETIEENEAIKNKAKEIIGNSRDENAIRELYDWVRSNIEYTVEPFNAENGFNPANPEETLKNRKGDCKDMAVLLSELLKSQGFSAEPALFGTYYKLPQKSAFNHVIVKVTYGGNTTWVDPTCFACPYSVLTPNMYRKYVLPISATELEKIPKSPGPDYSTVVNMTFDITKIDPVRITYDWEYGDLISSEEQRIKLQAMGQQELTGFYQQQARKLCQYPQLIEKSIFNLNDSLKPLTVHLVYDCSGIVGVEKDVLHFMVGSSGQLPSYLAKDTRQNDIYLAGSEYTRITTQVIFPEGYEISTKPIAYNYSGGNFSFTQTAEILGNQLTIDSKSSLKQLIPQEEYQELRKAYQAQLNTRQEIVAKKTGESTIAIAFLAIILLVFAALILRKNRK